MSEEPIEWLTTREFSQRHRNISAWLIGEMVRQQKLPHVRVGRRILIPDDALAQLAESQQQKRAQSSTPDESD